MGKCATCGKDAGVLADSCPHCGDPNPYGTGFKILDDTKSTSWTCMCGANLSPDASNCPVCGKENPGAGNHCFLTTACIRCAKLPDDCVELKAMRQFRDYYVKNMPNGSNLLGNYYRLAPMIVNRIDSQGNADDEYRSLLLFIRETIALIRSGKNKEALNLCVNKFNELKEKYNVY